MALLLTPTPLLLWAAVRLGVGGTSIALLTLAAAIIAQALRHQGPFAASSSIQDVIALQVFLVLISVPVLLLAAIVGAAGLKPTFAAAGQGSYLALANKECLVSAGDVFLTAVKEAGATLLPVDSEHSGAFQAIDPSPSHCIETITLTASGGPFREWDAARLSEARPEQALKHPNWSMGRKITIDSATLMNKGLELIEAFHLFPVEADQLRVLVHPQSVIHCLVQYCDGSVLAQMSSPDMRTPIAYSLAWPERMPAPTERLDFARLAKLTFEAPDEVRFPALRIAREALSAGGTAPTVLNAANEIAVEAFLLGRIGFMTIPKVVEAVLEVSVSEIGLALASTLDEVLEADRASRLLAERFCAAYRL
ncbi:MAG: 1-deoxy-D-xylulose-5-phosphate reductoisomerase [Rhodomicrobium sp.]|nr:1-deoxy-D-xylulose-5-phosphate reductoisomerase [Rhodomicrobium sp.]